MAPGEAIRWPVLSCMSTAPFPSNLQRARFMVRFPLVVGRGAGTGRCGHGGEGKGAGVVTMLRHQDAEPPGGSPSLSSPTSTSACAASSATGSPFHSVSRWSSPGPCRERPRPGPARVEVFGTDRPAVPLTSEGPELIRRRGAVVGIDPARCYVNRS